MSNTEIDTWIFAAAEHFIFYGVEGTREDYDVIVNKDLLDEDEEYDDDDM